MLEKNTIADLHIHSYASDSTDTPQEIISQVLEKNIGIVSLTDHNNVENQKEFIYLAKKSNITVITGVEISSKIDDMVYHIIAYGFNADDKRVSNYVNPIMSMMRENGRRVIQKMIPDYPVLDLTEFDSFTYDHKLGGWKSVHYLLDKGIIKKPIEGLAFRGIYYCPFYQCDYPSPKEVIEEIHKWDAYAVLAHPNSYFKNDPDAISIIQLFEEMRAYGIDGIECHYPSHTDLITDTSISWCQDNNMIITVGCDSHGTYVPGREIGKIRIPLSHLNIDPLLAK